MRIDDRSIPRLIFEQTDNKRLTLWRYLRKEQTMAFYKITYNAHYGFATVHNYGCTFHCPTCSYKLRSGSGGKPGLAFPRPDSYLKIEDIKNALRRLPIQNLYFMGGEPTVAGDLQEMLRFAKEELGIKTKLGHTNGSGLPLSYLDGANVGLKAWDHDLHRALTGHERDLIFDNVAAAYEKGIDLKINVVYVPGLVEIDQVEGVASWVASVDRNIPFHIMGYIPVPGQPYPQPTPEQMEAAERVGKLHLRYVNSSRIEPDHALNLQERDDRFNVTRII
jgi:pyruvate formate lyase activating enzyme